MNSRSDRLVLPWTFQLQPVENRFWEVGSRGALSSLAPQSKVLSREPRVLLIVLSVQLRVCRVLEPRSHSA